MDYEKSYKEALERARKLHSEPTGGTERIVCEQIFPELMESADERIRKAIIEHLRQDIELEQILSEEVGSDWITWLEKQGEQNLANSAKICKEDEEDWSEKDEKILKIIINDIQERHPEAMWKISAGNTVAVSTQYIIDWLKSLKEKLVVK